MRWIGQMLIPYIKYLPIHHHHVPHFLILMAVKVPLKLNFLQTERRMLRLVPLLPCL